VVAGLILGSCGGLSVNLPFVGAAPAEEASRARELRFRREVGPPDRYQAQYSVRIRNDLQVDETVTAELSYYCSGKEKGPPAHDRVIIWKQEAKRDLLEVRPKASRERRVTRRDTTRNWQPFVTPNTEAEPGRGGLRYIRFNELGQMLRATTTPYHFVWYDSLCYFWPVLPEHQVRPGDRWMWDVPVIVGREFTNNLMSLHARFHFVELQKSTGRSGADGPPVAVIEYTYFGLLDTGVPIDATKVPPNTPGLLWRRHAVEGEGRAYFDVEHGKVIWKSEKYTVTVERKTVSVTRKEEDKERREGAGPGEEDVEYHRTVNTVEFVARLLAPGEAASERPSRER
jgi:hypothetical protein